jgi:DNA repair exonuclease SbcCD nuclease subunit
VPFRFVHTADVHLDAPLRSLALRDAALADRVAAATRGAFARTVDLCLAERVDALLIAGDLYDGGQTSMTTARFVVDQFARLHAAGIRTFVIRGNHDALSRIARELAPPPSVTVFGARAGVEVLEAGALPVAVHGISFAEPQAHESLLPRFRPPVEGAANVGLLHTSLGGAAGHDPYAPCTLAELQATGFAYWALGHIHLRAEHPGRTHVVMPGMPQGRDIGEAGAKSVTLGLIDDAGRVTTATRPVALAEFRRHTLDLTGAEGWDAAVAALHRGLAGIGEGAGGADLVLRLAVRAAGPLAWLLRRDRDRLLEEAARAAAAAGPVWVEALALEGDGAAGATEAGGAGGAAGAEAPPAAGVIDELARIIETEVLPGEAFAAAAADRAGAVLAMLPREVRDRFGADAAAQAAALAALAREGVAEVLAALRAEGGGG